MFVTFVANIARKQVDATKALYAEVLSATVAMDRHFREFGEIQTSGQFCN